MAEAGPSSGRAGESACGECEDAEEAAAEAEMRALLAGDLGTQLLSAIEHVMAMDGDADEVAYCELRAYFKTHPQLAADILEAIDPEITEESMRARDWPLECFTACACETNCMKRLAAKDGGAILDALLARVREAAECEKATATEAAAEAGTGAQEAKRAKSMLAKSTWRSQASGASSSVLDALLAEEEATASAAAPAPADSVTVQVNSELVAHGCCQKGRLAFLWARAPTICTTNGRPTRRARACRTSSAESGCCRRRWRYCRTRAA